MILAPLVLVLAAAGLREGSTRGQGSGKASLRAENSTEKVKDAVGSAIDKVAVSPGGDFVAEAGEAGDVCIYSTISNRLKYCMVPACSDATTSPCYTTVKFVMDEVLLTASSSGDLCLWDVTDGSEVSCMAAEALEHGIDPALFEREETPRTGPPSRKWWKRAANSENVVLAPNGLLYTAAGSVIVGWDFNYSTATLEAYGGSVQVSPGSALPNPVTKLANVDLGELPEKRMQVVGEISMSTIAHPVTDNHAEKCVDGLASTCCRTIAEGPMKRSWVRIDLGAYQEVIGVSLTGSGDMSGTDSSDLDVSVSMVEDGRDARYCNRNLKTYAWHPVVANCSIGPVSGRFVWITHPGNTEMGLCEVNIWARGQPDGPTTTPFPESPHEMSASRHLAHIKKKYRPPKHTGPHVRLDINGVEITPMWERIMTDEKRACMGGKNEIKYHGPDDPSRQQCQDLCETTQNCHAFHRSWEMHGSSYTSYCHLYNFCDVTRETGLVGDTYIMSNFDLVVPAAIVAAKVWFDDKEEGEAEKKKNSEAEHRSLLEKAADEQQSIIASWRKRREAEHDENAVSQKQDQKRNLAQSKEKRLGIWQGSPRTVMILDAGAPVRSLTLHENTLFAATDADEITMWDVSRTGPVARNVWLGNLIQPNPTQGGLAMLTGVRHWPEQKFG